MTGTNSSPSHAVGAARVVTLSRPRATMPAPVQGMPGSLSASLSAGTGEENRHSVLLMVPIICGEFFGPPKSARIGTLMRTGKHCHSVVCGGLCAEQGNVRDEASDQRGRPVR